MTSRYRVPAPLQNTINNLGFIASTQEGDRLYFKEKKHYNTNNWILRMKRWYNNECYESQIRIIKEIVELGLDSIKSYETNVHYPRLVREFGRAKEGLHNLRNTYFKEGRNVNELDDQIYIMKNQLDAIPDDFKKSIGLEPPDYTDEEE